MSIIKKNNFNIDNDEMMKAGVHLGHRVSKLHPKMKGYIFGVRNTTHIIDLEKTIVEFEKVFITRSSTGTLSVCSVTTLVPYVVD